MSYTVRGTPGKAVVIFLPGADAKGIQLDSARLGDTLLVIPDVAVKRAAGKAWTTRPPPQLQLFVEVVQSASVARGWECSLLGFSRGAFWASYFALHMPRLSKLAVLGYYPEPGEEALQSQLHGAALRMPTLLLMSEADPLSLISKAEPFARGLQSRAQELQHIILVVRHVSHEGLWTIADATAATAGRPEEAQLHDCLWHFGWLKQLASLRIVHHVSGTKRKHTTEI